MRRKIMIRASLSVLLVAGVVGAALQAYVLKGSRWSSHQVPYYINPANADLPESAVEAAIQAGAAAWTVQTQADFAFYYAGRTTGTSVGNNGKNEVFFRSEASGSAIASTYSWSSSSGLVDTDVVFWDGAYQFFGTGDACSGGFYVEDIAAHEFGHALGLAHSDMTPATMYYGVGYCTQSLRSLDADDVSGVEALYPAGGTPPPTAPSNLSAAPEGGSPSTAIDVSWADNSSDEERFLVERSVDGVSWSQVAEVGANATSFRQEGLSAETAYSFRVRASNSGGFSGYTNVATATTAAAAGPPAAPSAPSPSNNATAVSANADLAWASSGATTYDVYWGTASSPPLYASGVGAPGLALPRLAAGSTYYWRIVAKNGSGETSGPIWRFTTKSSKGGGRK